MKVQQIAFSAGILFFSILFQVNVHAQERTIEGKVTTYEQYPLHKVTVTAKRSGNEVLTDTTGYYSLVCDENDKLVFEANGFFNERVRLKNVEPGDSVNLNMRLKNGDKNFEVATGYGHIEEEKLTHAIQHFESEKNDYSNYDSILDIVEGRISGVSVAYDGIKVRGTNTMGGEDSALLVVDGSVVSFSVFQNIPPSQVKSIDVLKGASASARYGSRGMGGVILVKTKSGE